MRRLPFRGLLLPVLYLAMPAIAAGAEAHPDYRIGPRDLISVAVAEDPSLTTETQVSAGGTVLLPVLGQVEVDGLTTAEAEQRIRGLLEESLLQRATVSVQVREFLSRPITVLGAVNRPGTLAVSRRLPLLQALNEAGGVTPEHGGKVKVVRRADNGLRDEIVVDLDRLLLGVDPALNLPVFSGDVVQVMLVEQITVLFIGEVERPGTVEMRSNERITLLFALARAGGLTDRASKQIRIKRRGPDGRQREIQVSYKAIVEGKVPDPPLQDGDLILVKEAFF